MEDICDRDGNGSLQELHLENQNLPKGHALVFEPDSLESLRYTLRVLNISGNNILNIDGILSTCHATLHKLDASNNSIKSLDTSANNSHAPAGNLRFPYRQLDIMKGF